MGCITSRGYLWPPRPYKRFIVSSKLVTQEVDGVQTSISVDCEDYIWVRPGCELRNGCGGTTSRDGDEASPLQAVAIRRLESD